MEGSASSWDFWLFTWGQLNDFVETQSGGGVSALSQALCMRGQAYFNLGHSIKAEADFQRAVSLDNQNTLAATRLQNLKTRLEAYMKRITKTKAEKYYTTPLPDATLAKGLGSCIPGIGSHSKLLTQSLTHLDELPPHEQSLFGPGGADAMLNRMGNVQLEMQQRRAEILQTMPSCVLSDVDWSLLASLFCDCDAVCPNSVSGFLLDVNQWARLDCAVLPGESVNLLRFLLSGFQGPEIRIPFAERLRLVRRVLFEGLAFLNRVTPGGFDFKGVETQMRERAVTFLERLCRLAFSSVPRSLSDPRPSVVFRIATDEATFAALAASHIFSEEDFLALDFLTFIRLSLSPDSGINVVGEWQGRLREGMTLKERFLQAAEVGKAILKLRVKAPDLFRHPSPPGQI
uniref:Uncharacterized protein n=1 Tax=Chromera velia CCMP2878 TaxID=1169474 RepID=A0A0G4IBI0_9ALVE|eukprot:Cvel_12838.t1-p1 / transcript=Cvel_12838.t1 / gene=Cvel_12838 / organism=Chromera_velia_CCMP2878 / gene_product=hypothetical protein / transcript_product=hypothetical protein / location=Cvel_scaffold856:40159-41361(+) / protein_length=401 / sequence_SO=supercontig / SO=protein_coding / is_pseudo=false